MNSTMTSSSTFLCNVAILAGGQGTRLASRSGDLPKPMVPVMGKPVLQHQIELCRKHGFTDIALLVHHRHEAISDFFGDGARFGVRIRYEVEETPRGTSGALRDALHALTPQFLLLYGDTYLDIDLRRFFNAHLASDANATLFLHPNDHPYDSDLVDIDDQGLVRGIHPYPHPEGQDLRNLVNAALYAVRNESLTTVTPATGKADIAKHMFPAMLAEGLCLRGYVTPEYIKDMGTPDRLDKVERDIEVGLPERLSWRRLRKAVFLDRDGTLNREVNHLKSPDQIELLPGVGEAVRQLNRAGVLAVLTTNQPVIARGDVTVDGLHRIHARLESLLGAQRAYLDAIYYCPHHPDKGFDGEVSALKIICDCRKPATGMIEQASRDLAISRADSWMVGDSTADVESGRRAGVRTVLLQTGHAGRDAKHPGRPDYSALSLTDAVQWITVGHDRARRRLAPVALAALDRRVVLIGGLARSGKSSAAQVLKELLAVLGKEAHVISLDGWLKPGTQRGEGTGVLDRYDLPAAAVELGALARAEQRVDFEEPVYDRFARDQAPRGERHSVGRDDILIVEGVPALYLPALTSPNHTLKLFLNESEDIRVQRLKDDYTARGYPVEKINEILESRSADETATIRKSAESADQVIDWEK
ncbi:HAD-IIIA family hydrolase [Mitsuaria sp. TWR114]|uniref:HAD-IIIA family hydrolase n=1 Tax=Mitsuaria sp. TWR114 TaxID=2601731 RepID=UPI0011BF6732|nr:HAD-IIIA family hydrolase [Mitsuaria sp. TWR114]TXD99722.1 HAD-IIIA family hydrolase [Mitsuaria sp. TWR114]